MQTVSCDDVWFRNMEEGLHCLVGLRAADKASLHVLFSKTFDVIDTFTETKSQLEADLPGGLDIVGIGLMGIDINIPHTALQKSLSGLDEPAVVLQSSKSMGIKPVVRVTDKGLLKPFSGSLQVQSIVLQNVVMRVPVNIRLSDVPSQTLVEKWFHDSVIFTAQDGIEGDSNILIQRGVVRTSDFERPTMEQTRFTGIVTLTAVIEPKSDPSIALTRSFFRRLWSAKPHTARSLYIAQSLCSSPIIFCISNRDLFPDLSQWKHEFNVPVQESGILKRIPTLVPVLVVLLGFLITYLFYRVRSS